MMASCRQQGSKQATEQTQQTKPAAKIEFVDDTQFNFGNYSVRDTIEHYFVYKNVGNVPFVINNIETSCGCTRAYYSHRPLPPGAKDSIRVTYDGNGFVEGFFMKNCEVYSNAEVVFQLRIEGRYIPEAE